MDLDSKISALKDFTSFGSSSKNGSSSSRTNQTSQGSNSSSANGWGNWIAKGEKDPFLPSLVGFDWRLFIFIFFLLFNIFLISHKFDNVRYNISYPASMAEQPKLRTK